MAHARLGRYAEIDTHDPRFLEILAAVESDGHAMRYLDRNGRIAWKATPRLRAYLNDLRLLTRGSRTALASEYVLRYYQLSR
jgi:hypothetical protein